MRRHWKRIIAMLVVAGLAQQCTQMEASDNGESQEPTTGTTPRAETFGRVVNVETVEVVPTTFVDFIRITGEAEARHDIMVSSEEGGVLTGFLVEKGAEVRRGQTLVRLDASVLAAQVDEARAAASLADEQFARQRRLWEDERIGSEIAFLQARYQADMARARLAMLEARLDKTRIRAPVAGVFDEHFVDEGEIVMPGTGVARVVSIDTVKVVGGVPERYAPYVRTGGGAVVTFDIMPDRRYEGSISFVGSSVDKDSRTFPIEIVTANPTGTIKPMMVANVRIVREELTDVIVLSQDHVVRSESGYHVYMVEQAAAGPVARRRSVTLGAAFAGQVVIESGLEAGEIIVGLGAQLVDNGSRLALVPSEAGGSNDE